MSSHGGSQVATGLLRFGGYEADLQAGELRKHGLRIRLPDQPFQLLTILLERPGELVSREELQRRLWASDTFVDFDRGLNKAMNRLRETLGDSAEKPRFIETLPKRGYRFIAALEPEAVGFEPASASIAPSNVLGTISATAARPAPPTPWVLLGVLATLLLGAVGTALFVKRRPRPVLTPVVSLRASLNPPPNAAFLPGNFALSPDGARLAFAGLAADGRTTLWIRSLSASGAHRLEATEGATFPFWSPDGQQVGFFADGKLKVVEIAAGAVRVLADAPIPRGGAWSRHGVIVFVPGIAQPLHRVSVSGGQSVPVSTGPERTSRSPSWPTFLPDGTHFLYAVQWTTPDDRARSGLYAGSLDSDRDALVSPEIVGNVTLSSGHLLFVRRGRVMAQPFDLARLRVTGAASPVSEQELDTETISRRSGFSASENGVMVFESATDFGPRLVVTDPLGRELTEVPEQGCRDPSLSLDGRLLAMSCDQAHRGAHSICVYDLERRVSTPITEGADDDEPVWSRDGRQVTFASRSADVSSLKRVAIDRSGAPQELLRGGRMVPRDWSKDGGLVFAKVRPGGADLHLLRDGQATSLGPGAEAHLSPDGHWLVNSGVIVRPFGATGPRIQISNGGSQPRWSHDGRRLFYVAPDKKLMAVEFEPEKGVAGPPRALFQTRIIGASIVGFQYDVFPDGRFVINSLPDPSSPLTLITDWTAGRGQER